MREVDLQMRDDRSVLTSAGRLRLVPLGVLDVDTLDDDGALLQSVSRVARKLHHGPHPEPRVAAAEVPVLHKRAVARAFSKRWRIQTNMPLVQRPEI